MLLYIYKAILGDRRLEPTAILISGYGDSPVANKGSGTTILLIGCQTPWKTTFQVTDMRGYLILDREMVQQIVYIYFPKISPPKLAQQPKKHTHLKTINRKSLRHMAANKKGHDLKCPRVQLLNCAVLINRKRHRLPITKVYILEEYHGVFKGVGILPGKVYHITLKKDYVPV